MALRGSRLRSPSTPSETMSIDFSRDTDGVPVARASRADWQALSGLLTSDVGSIDNASELLALLRRAAESGASVKETGNAFTVLSKGATSVVEFAIDESIRPVHLSTRDLSALLAAWISFLQSGSPRAWHGGDGSPQIEVRPPQ